MANLRISTSDIARRLVTDEITKAEADRRVGAVMGAILAELNEGNDVYLNDIGLLNVIARNAKSGVVRHVVTGEPMTWEKPRRLGIRLDPARALEKHLETLQVTEAFDKKTKTVSATTEAGTTDAEAIINAVDSNSQPAPEPAMQPTETAGEPAVTQN